MQSGRQPARDSRNRGDPGPGRRRQHRSGNRAAVQTTASRSLPSASAVPRSRPAVGAGAERRQRIANARPACAERRTGRCASRSPSAASPSSSSAGNSLSPMLESLPAALKFRSWLVACPAVEQNSIPSTASPAASRDQRRSCREMPRQCRGFGDMPRILSSEGRHRLSILLISRCRLSQFSCKASAMTAAIRSKRAKGQRKMPGRGADVTCCYHRGTAIARVGRA